MRSSDFVFDPQEHLSGQSSSLMQQPDNSFCIAEIIEPQKMRQPQQVTLTEITAFSLIELILKERRQLYQMLGVQSVQSSLLTRLLAIALAGFVLFGIAMSLVLSVSGHWPSLMGIAAWLKTPAGSPLLFEPIHSDWGYLAPWGNGQALSLVGAYAFGLVAASGVCLPSLYFYCLLAGVRMTMLEIVVHAVKSKAIAAVALVGILPIYVAVAMGIVIFGASKAALDVTLLLGLALPFVAGIWGTVSLYQGFLQSRNSLSPDRATHRECFLHRLVLSWSACYSAVMPVMIYSLWEVFSRG